MRRLLALAAVTLLFTACEAPPYYGPSPIPSVQPFFESKEEVAGAVEPFLDAYLAASNNFLLSGGADREPLMALVSERQLADEVAFLEELQRDGETFVGHYGYFGLEVQQFDQDSPTSAYVQVYLCIDYRESRYLRADGTVFEGERPWSAFEAIMTATSPAQLHLEELRSWTGRDFCEQRS